jgi:dynein heavy chain 2
MPDQNSKHLKTVYEKAEELFSRLEGAVVEYLPWSALGNIDIQSYIEANFTTVQDWEDNFQMLRLKRKELKKLPDSFKVDCININIVPFKAGIDELFRRMTDALVETLQESIERDADSVHNFIRKGLEKLSKNPKSVEEIELMNKHAMEIGVEKGSIVKIFQGCELKNKMIK